MVQEVRLNDLRTRDLDNSQNTRGLTHVITGF
jgi:hypothetical protein